MWLNAGWLVNLERTMDDTIIRIAIELYGGGIISAQIEAMTKQGPDEKRRARDYLLDDIEFRYSIGLVELEKASEYYAALDAPPERVRQFPQRAQVLS